MFCAYSKVTGRYCLFLYDIKIGHVLLVHDSARTIAFIVLITGFGERKILIKNQTLQWIIP